MTLMLDPIIVHTSSAVSVFLY